MFKLRYADEADRPFWFSLDEHLSEGEFELKIRCKRCYIIEADSKPIGVLRYNMFWDMIPFLTFIYVEEAYQNKGLGRQAVSIWESDMRLSGHKMVMTSTQVDENAQHFYRKLGYVDKGGILFDNTPFNQPMEMILIKSL